jgi:hypothetical protein
MINGSRPTFPLCYRTPSEVREGAGRNLLHNEAVPDAEICVAAGKGCTKLLWMILPTERIHGPAI